MQFLLGLVLQRRICHPAAPPRQSSIWDEQGSPRRFGDAVDNTVSEAFNRVLEVEYVHRQHFRSRAENRITIGTWITDFHNTRRMHSRLVAL